jgi:hypothetical protein
MDLVRSDEYAPDVTLPDQDTGMMDALRKTQLEYLGLQPPLQKVLNLQRQHVVEPHPMFVQDADTDETADQGVTLEQALGVLCVEFEELTGRTTDF